MVERIEQGLAGCEAGGMDGFLDAFERQPDGSWVCVRPAEWQSPYGRIQITEGSRFAPGTVFMGVHLAELLDNASVKLR